MGYQPKLTEEFITGLRTGNYVTDVGDEPRKTTSRLISIVKFIKSKYTNLERYNAIDVGCNDGFFTNSLSSLGISTLGIDNNGIFDAGHVPEKPIIVATRIADELNIHDSLFHETDIIDFFDKSEEKYDFSLVLSVMHNLMLYKTFRGGREATIQDIDECFTKIWNNTRRVMFFETDTTIGKAFGWDDKSQVSNIERLCKNSKVTQIGVCPAYNGLRRLFAVERVGSIPKRVSKHKVTYIAGSGTEKFFIEKYEDTLKKAFGLENIYHGSINMSHEYPLAISYDIFGVKLNYRNRYYKMSKCSINGTIGYLTQSRGQPMEFFTDREVPHLGPILDLEFIGEEYDNN